MKNSLSVTQEVSLLDIADLLCCAWEGGSNYWARAVDKDEPTEWTLLMKDDPHHYQFLVPLNGGSVYIHDIEEDKKHVLSFAGIKRGMKIMAEKYPAAWGDFISENYDANTGDCFLQCCIFGEVIYG